MFEYLLEDLPATPLPRVSLRTDFAFFRLDSYPMSYPELPNFGPGVGVLPLSQREKKSAKKKNSSNKGFFLLLSAKALRRPDIKNYKWSADVRRDSTGEICQIYARRVEAVPVIENGKPVYIESCGKMIVKRKCRTIYLHQVLKNAKEGFDVDHKNGFGLDNRDINLRVVSKSVNSGNRPSVRKVHPHLPRGVKSINYKNGAVAYQATITCKGVRHTSPIYKDMETASAWYQKKHTRFFGLQPHGSGKADDRPPLPKYVPPKFIPARNHKGEEQIPF